MFSPELTRRVPETVWLPPEIRASLDESHEPVHPAPPKELLKHGIQCLSSRIEHVEYLLEHSRIEERLKRLEPQVVYDQSQVTISRRSGA